MSDEYGTLTVIGLGIRKGSDRMFFSPPTGAGMSAVDYRLEEIMEENAA